MEYWITLYIIGYIVTAVCFTLSTYKPDMADHFLNGVTALLWPVMIVPAIASFIRRHS